MKKNLITLALLAMVAMTAGAETKKAQNDTTVVKAPVAFRTEHYTTKTGNDKTRYIATVDGKEYASNKTSAERYADIKRWNGTPCVVKITTPSGSVRITVL